MKKQYLVISIAISLTLAVIVAIVVFAPKYDAPSGDNNSLSSSSGEAVKAGVAPAMTKIRRPAVAGDFYPKEPAMLNKQLEDYLSEAQKIPAEGKLRILIVPHAGTIYSGATTARGFKQLEGEDYQRVIIMGVSHKSPIAHAAVYSQGWWETPFGNLEIDEELAKKIISDEHEVRADDIPHQDEHSLELPLLFLAKVQKQAKIVPILLGRPNDQLIEYLSFRLAGLMDEETLLIISTDLSHYPNWQDANYADSNTIKAILTGRVEALDNMVAYNTPDKYPGLSTSACGYRALRVALKLSQWLGFTDIREIDYTNSGDITGEKGRVVGYAAIGFWSREIVPLKLDDETKKEALKLVRDTLNSHYGKTELSYTPLNPSLSFPIGAFVTLTKEGALRGCIGNFEPEDPLYKVIQSVAVAAATKDARFTPVTQEELKNIEIEISTMSPQRLIRNWQDVEIGKQGVHIILGNKSGTLLPQIATDNNYDLVTFLETICWQKMGLDKQCYKDPAAKLYVYETDIFSESELLE